MLFNLIFFFPSSIELELISTPYTRLHLFDKNIPKVEVPQQISKTTFFFHLIQLFLKSFYK